MQAYMTITICVILNITKPTWNLHEDTVSMQTLPDHRLSIGNRGVPWDELRSLLVLVHTDWVKDNIGIQVS